MWGLLQLCHSPGCSPGESTRPERPRTWPAHRVCAQSKFKKAQRAFPRVHHFTLWRPRILTSVQTRSSPNIPIVSLALSRMLPPAKVYRGVAWQGHVVGAEMANGASLVSEQQRQGCCGCARAGGEDRVLNLWGSRAEGGHIGRPLWSPAGP